MKKRHRRATKRARESRHPVVPFLRAIAMSLICVPPVGLLLFFTPTPIYSVGSSRLWVWILLSLLGVGIVARILLSDWALDRFSDGHRRRRGRFEAPLAHADVVDYYLARFLSSSYELSNATASAAALVSPPSVTSRIIERYVLGDHRSEIEVTRTVQGSVDLVLVPILRVDKGELVGKMAVDIDGTPARTLPFDETRGLLLTMLLSTFAIVHGNSQPELLQALKTAVVGRSSVDSISGAPLQSALEAAAATSTALDSDKTVLRRLATAACSKDFVFAIVPEGLSEPRRIKVSYQRIYDGGIRGFATRLQRAIGLGRGDFSIPVALAGDSRSYHLEVEGPESMYVENAYVHLPVLGASERFLEHTSPDDRARDQVMIVSPRAGDNRAHLYLRDYDGNPHLATEGDSAKLAPVRPRFRVEFRETPPGLVGPILAVSFWLMLLAWTVGYFHDFVFKGQGIVGPSWPTLIFSVPAIVVGWLLSRVTTSQFRTISIGTFALLATLALNAAMLVTFAALKSSGVAPWVVDIGLFHIGHLTWTIMMALTGVHFSACFAVLTTRNLRYAATINEGSRVDDL